MSTSMLHHHPSQEEVSPPTRSTTEAVSQSHNNLSHKRNTPRSQTPNICAAPVFPRSRQLATELLGLACFHEPNLFNSHVLQTTINDRRCMFLYVVAEIPNSVWFVVVVVKRSVKRVWESGEMDARMACGMLHASCVS